MKNFLYLLLSSVACVLVLGAGCATDPDTRADGEPTQALDLDRGELEYGEQYLDSQELMVERFETQRRGILQAAGRDSDLYDHRETHAVLTEARQKRHNVAYESWDFNDDGLLDEEEFDAAFTGRGELARWDLDRDDRLDARELRAANFERWDADADTLLDEDEWRRASSRIDAELDAGGFSEWDIDDDDLLDEGEFAAAYQRAGWFATWDVDADGRLDEGEFRDASFRQLDADRNGLLDSAELRRANW